MLFSPGRRCALHTSLRFGGLHPGGLQSHTSNFGARGALTGLGAYSLGAYNLTTNFRARDALTELGAYNLESYNLGPTISHHQLWNQGCTQRTGGLQSRGGLGAYSLGVYSLTAPTQSQGCTHWTGGLQSGGLQPHTTDFGARDALTGLRAYRLGGLQSGSPQSGSLQYGAL